MSKYLKENKNLLVVLFTALVFRLFLSNFGTLNLDHGTFVAWANNLAVGGLNTFYNGWSDYFPGYLYVLYLLGKVNISLPGYTDVLFKFPAIVADLLTSLVIYKALSRNGVDKNKSLIFTIIYLFNPAVFSNSSLWGQVDGFIALFVVLTVYLFDKHLIYSAISLAVGALIKPQVGFMVPVIIYLFISRSKSFKDFIYYSIVSAFVFVLGFVPFNNTSNLLTFILERFNLSANQYPYGSVNAFSFWGLFGFWKTDTYTVWIGLVIFIITTLLSIFILIRKKIKNGEYTLLSIVMLASFMFVTRMHERHLLPTLAPLLISSGLNYLLIYPYIILSITYVANLRYAYVWISNEYKEIFNLFFIKFFIVLNLSALVSTIYSLYKRIVRVPLFTYSRLLINKQHLFKTKDFSVRTSKLLLALIVIFGFVTRFYAINYPKDMYFDEIYHAFTAKLVLHNDPKAWEWWNPHPEGYAYEWTHPPLSKLGMALSMKVFGENQVGWRIPEAILGTLSIVLVYLLSYEIFKDKKLSLLSSFILSLDGLLLVLSRMGMNDTYVLFFSMLSVLFFIKNKNLMSAFSFGLAIASKWSAIYVLPIIFISHFVFKKKFNISYLSFLTVPVIVYVLSYSLMFATGHSWSQFIEVQKQMWWYHTNLKADHPYTSPAWTWPILFRPIYLYDGGVENNITSRIYAMGNPFVFWIGVLSILSSIVISAKEKNKRLGFVVFSYIIFFLPWIASPRIMFLYHYLPSIPYMTIATAFVLRRLNKTILPTLAVMLLAFMYFYPHWTAIKIPLWLDETYYWFSSWR